MYCVVNKLSFLKIYQYTISGTLAISRVSENLVLSTDLKI